MSATAEFLFSFCLRAHTNAHLVQSIISVSISTHVAGAQINIAHIDGDVVLQFYWPDLHAVLDTTVNPAILDAELTSAGGQERGRSAGEEYIETCSVWTPIH